jgi:mono/diheme cytochrome c family protein
MQRTARWSAAALVCTLLYTVGAASADRSANTSKQIKRGAYLVAFGGCHDCHTPKTMTPNGPAPDMARALSGHPADAKLPAMPTDALGPDKWMAVTNEHLTAWAGPWGVSFAANLTPDKRTGLGNWTADQFVKAMRTGKHLGVGRPILPPMPWFNLNALDDEDLRAVFAYLQSIAPIENPVPAPIPPK